MADCGFPANSFGDNGQCREFRFYPASRATYYDDQGAGRNNSPDRWRDEPKLVNIAAFGESDGGPAPASLLVLSATGTPRPALLRALDPDEQWRLCPGA